MAVAPSGLPLAAVLASLAVPLARGQDQNAPPAAGFDFAARRASHWAWQPLRDAAPPAVRAADWVQDPLDLFVLAALEQRGLRPAPAADAPTWLRRVWFDLAGLPPPPDAVAAFAADASPAARARVVDALLASPHYGERWGRHWLDLVRYAESLGHEYDFPIPNAWRYRDYVIRALNADVPFDQFGREHLAGDLLPAPRLDPATGMNESVQATAAFWFGEQTHSPVDVRQHEADRIDNQIDVLCKSLLGMTVACARCHDHKFDAIRSDDYYALYGFLNSSRYVQQPLFPTAAAAAAAVLDAHGSLVRLLPAAAPPAAPGAPAAVLRPGDRLLADLGTDPPGWLRVGDAFPAAPWPLPFVTGVDDAAVHCRALPGAWANSAALARERNGTLLSPTFRLDAPYLHVEVAGQGARVLLVLEGLHLLRDPIYGGLHRAVDRPDPHWLTFDVRMWQGGRAHLQFVDQDAHDLADPDRNGRDYPHDAWLAARTVLASDQQEPPPAAAALPVADLPRGAGAVEDALAALRAAAAALPPVATLPAMADGTGADEHVFLRGSHRQPGPLAPRHFLAAIAGDAPMALPAGSGRLALAEAVFAPDDPLPARVFVNRVWHHLFGRGLVRSVDNLGHLGERPTHPDLLDRLARDTVRDGWSQKRLIRRIVLSATYAQASRGDPAAEAADPGNLLLHRQNLRRLEGEALRDALLAFGGRLDERLYGPPVPLPLDDDDEARGKPDVAGPLDGNGRRSIYLAMQRNFLPDLLLAFDLPTPFTTVGARNVSNVPAQALALLNDPFVHSMCALAADHLLAGPATTVAARLERLFLATVARRPAPDEAAACAAFVAARQRATGAGADDPRPWADLAHALVERKEFAFLR